MSVAFRNYIYEVEEYGAPLEELPALREELEKMCQEAKMREIAERAKRVPSYIPAEPEDDGLPFWVTIKKSKRYEY